jgi:hypothetical protein
MYKMPALMLAQLLAYYKPGTYYYAHSLLLDADEKKGQTWSRCIICFVVK